METRPISAGPLLPQPPVRTEAAPVREAVATELPAPKAVTAQVGADQTRGQKSRQALPAPANDRKSNTTTDRDTGDLVYQVINPQSRAVLFQSPHESILKLRAYIAQTERQHEYLLGQEHQEQRQEEYRKEIERHLRHLVSAG